MERMERDAFVSPTEPTVPLAEERTPPPPRFDEKSVQRAQPAVPLAFNARAGSRTLWVIALCIVGGLVGGVLGGLALTYYQSRGETTAAQQMPTEAPVAPVATPTEMVKQEPRPSPTTVEERVDAGNGEPVTDAQGELRAALGGWLAATNERDVGRQMNYYAPTVEAFYLSRNATRESVRAEKARLFARASAVNVEAAPPEIRLSADGRTAVMRFRKRYRIDGADSRAGEVLQELRWRRTDSGWKIVGERDLRVLQ